MTAAPLDGLHILELATGVAGPYAGRLLAMLGATVVKLEPNGGDPVRNCCSPAAISAGKAPPQTSIGSEIPASLPNANKVVVQNAIATNGKALHEYLDRVLRAQARGIHTVLADGTLEALF